MMLSTASTNDICAMFNIVLTSHWFLYSVT